MARTTTGTRARRLRRAGRREDGAALVEFAFVAPLLFLLVFGIIEFGWGFLQYLDVRHGARETARLAAVNYRTTAGPTADEQRTQIITEACSRMDAGTGVNIEIILVDGPDNPSVDSDRDISDEVQVRVIDPQIDTLTGFFDFMLTGVDLTSTVHIRLEQAATYSETPVGGLPCP